MLGLRKILSLMKGDTCVHLYGDVLCIYAAKLVQSVLEYLK